MGRAGIKKHLVVCERSIIGSSLFCAEKCFCLCTIRTEAFLLIRFYCIFQKNGGKTNGKR